VIEFAKEFLLVFWGTIKEMSPFLLFGFLVAGILAVFFESEFIERHLGGRGIRQVFNAALFGVPLPLCSCGVIPVAASLKKHGAGSGATASFLISTPQTGIDSIMVTLSLLGPVFAVFRPIVAFVSGILGGVLVNLLGDEPPEEEIDEGALCKNDCFVDGTFGGEDTRSQTSHDHEAAASVEAGGTTMITDSLMMEGENDDLGGNAFAAVPVTDSFSTKSSRTMKRVRFALKYGFFTLPKDINKTLIVGIVVAAGISALVPDDYFSGVLGTGLLSMLVMMAVGIPIYVCATASVPIAAALMMKGISPGAALVFLMTGPATNAATISTIWKIMGKRSAVIYLATVAVSALAAGAVLNEILGTGYTTGLSTKMWMIPGWLGTASAIALVAVLAGTFSKPTKVGSVEMKEGLKKLVIRINGMTCEHCAMSIRRALLETKGIESAEVDAKEARAIVTGGDFDFEAIKFSIESLGYGVEGIEEMS